MKFTKLLKNIIVESRVEILLNKFTEPIVNKDGKKMKPKLTKEEFFKLVEADPTTKMNEVDPFSVEQSDLSKIKAGSYVNWLIKQFLSIGSELNPDDTRYKQDLKSAKDLFMEDLYKVTDDLKKFERFKNRLPKDKRDITQYTTDSLYDAVKDFDLTLATTTKAERKTAEVHPGAKLVFDGDEWRVIEISDKGEKGREAACFYGGNQKETRWCTSAPGLSWFETYINRGPLYVIFRPKDSRVSPTTGLPVERYQFSFASDQFMDKDDRTINLAEMLNGEMKELKEFFKPYFMQSVVLNGESIEIDGFDRGSIGKFVKIYGFKDLMKTIPDTVTNISITIPKESTLKQDINLNDIARLKNLRMIYFENCISEVPDSLCNLQELTFIGFPNNPNLKTLPECLADLPKIKFINCKGSDNLELTQYFSEKGMVLGNNMVDFFSKRRKNIG